MALGSVAWPPGPFRWAEGQKALTVVAAAIGGDGPGASIIANLKRRIWHSLRAWESQLRRWIFNRMLGYLGFVDRFSLFEAAPDLSYAEHDCRRCGTYSAPTGATRDTSLSG